MLIYLNDKQDLLYFDDICHRNDMKITWREGQRIKDFIPSFPCVIRLNEETTNRTRKKAKFGYYFVNGYFNAVAKYKEDKVYKVDNSELFDYLFFYYAKEFAYQENYL